MHAGKNARRGYHQQLVRWRCSMAFSTSWIAYSASKNAIDGMTRAMAVELSPNGIRVNAIAPGFITTAMTAKAFSDDPDRMNKAMGRTPMGIFQGKSSYIGEAALFLASDAARYITGVILPVDGGNSIGF